MASVVGYGSGYGYGYGDGYGSGYGDGDGYGEERATYLNAVLESVPLPAHAEGATRAFWRSDAQGRSANGGTSEPAYAGKIDEVPGPLQACSAHALHGALNPRDWKGERLWVVALYPPVIEDHQFKPKLASLKREIIMEIPNWFPNE